MNFPILTIEEILQGLVRLGASNRVDEADEVFIQGAILLIRAAQIERLLLHTHRPKNVLDN